MERKAYQSPDERGVPKDIPEKLSGWDKDYTSEPQGLSSFLLRRSRTPNADTDRVVVKETSDDQFRTVSCSGVSSLP